MATNNIVSTSPQPQPVNLSATSGFSSTPSSSTSSSTTSSTFQVPPALVQQQVSSLDAQLNRINVISSSGSGSGSTMTEAERASLVKALQDTKNTLIAQQQQNVDLSNQLNDTRKQLDSLRELLLSSTSMIFKMDELLPTA
jgi:hypothetical protein